jgi:hypothetical protein
MSITFRYLSGEEIKGGDHVHFHGNPAQIEFVACDPNDPESAWYFQEFGGGVMILDPKVSSQTFIEAKSLPEYEDLQFVSRE